MLSSAPRDILTYILSFLSPNEICATKLVSKQFRILGSDNSLWKKKLIQHFPELGTEKVELYYPRFIRAFKDYYGVCLQKSEIDIAYKLAYKHPMAPDGICISMI